MILRLAGIVLGLLGIVLAPAPAGAQSNLDAGKSAAQIFSHTCNACHRSPRELKPTSAAFLRDHYTAGSREAAAMAAYVASIGSDPEAVKQRRRPALGAGRDSPVDTASRSPPATPGADQDAPSDTAIRPPASIPLPDQARQPEVQAALPSTLNRRTPAGQARSPQSRASAAIVRPRRPSDSIEGAQQLLGPFTGALSASAEAAPRLPPLEPFEE